MSWGLTNTAGTSLYNGTNTYNSTKIMVADNYQPATIENVTTYRIYGRDAATPSNVQLQVGIYDVTSGVASSATLVHSQIVTLPFVGAAQWNDFSVSGAPLLNPAKKYARALGQVTSGTNSDLYRIAATNKAVSQAGLMPDPIGAGSTTYSYDFVFEVVTTPVSQLIDSISSPMRVGESISITTTGLGSLTTATTIGGLAVASASAPSGDGTVTCWSFVDGAVRPAMGSVIVIASDGTNSTSGTTVPLTTMTGYTYVTASGILYDNYSLAKAFPSVVEGDQVHIETPAGASLLPNLNLVDFPDGTYQAWWRNSTTGVMTQLIVYIAEGGAVISVGGLTVAGLTTSGLTTAGITRAGL